MLMLRLMLACSASPNHQRRLPIRVLGNNPFAAATLPAFITALTRLAFLYARAVPAASARWACDECAAQGLRKMQRHWPRALGNLRANLAHDIVRASP
jgi:hypothetical protein